MTDIYAERYRGMTREQQTCCLTGHRKIPPGEERKIMVRARNILLRLIRDHNVRYFGVGGAVGFDMLAAEYLLNLKAHEEQQIKIISVLPYPAWREWFSLLCQLLQPAPDRHRLYGEIRLESRGKSVQRQQFQRDDADIITAENRPAPDLRHPCPARCGSPG